MPSSKIFHWVEIVKNWWALKHCCGQWVVGAWGTFNAPGYDTIHKYRIFICILSVSTFLCNA